MPQLLNDNNIVYVGFDYLGNAIKVMSDPEYLYVIKDNNDTFLFGIQKDGTVDWAKGLPEFLENILNSKQDKVEGKSLINETFANGVKVIATEEFIFLITDTNDTPLLGIRKDGSIYIANYEQIVTDLDEKVDKENGKSLIDSVFANGVNFTKTEQYIFAITDKKSNLLFGIETDGSVTWSKGIPDVINDILANKQDKIAGKTVIDENMSTHTSSIDDYDWSYLYTDENDHISEGIHTNGEHEFFAPVSFREINWSDDNLSDLSTALKESGFTGGTGDWSDNESLEIPIPEMAIINFTNIDHMPQTKDTNAHAYMQFWDMHGNYFKKKVIANAQGSSSMKWSKKNIGIDICNDDWIGNDTFKIKFGDWIPQDSFHIKAYATDYFKCVGLVGYDVVKEIMDTRVLNTTWKQNANYGTNPIATKAVSPRIDSGALCYPQGFICKVYLNGNFEGLFCWQLKKHRDNYNMNKKDTKNIHIEGMLGATYFWNGNIDWTQFEIRNPKDLISYDGSKYDGDNPTELIDSSSPYYDSSNSKHKNTAKVKQYIINLSKRMLEVVNAGNDKTLFEKYFGLDSCIDYAVFSDALYNYDYVKNIQWTTWDGKKWFLNFYDLDCIMGANSSADSIHYPTRTHTTIATMHPLNFVLNNYNTELEARWAELRKKKIIDAKHISDKLDHYMKTWGKDAYDAEEKRWPDYPYNRDMIVDTENWELEVDSDGNPVIYTGVYHIWNESTNYAQGYVVQYNPSTSSQPSQGWYYRFTAKQNNINKKPVTKTGFKDNFFRVYNWLQKQISNMDIVYHYTEGE